MSGKLHPSVAYAIQKEFLWQDRSEALAVFLEGQARERFRVQVEFDEMYADYHREKMSKEHPAWSHAAYTFRTRQRIRDLIHAVDDGTYARSDESSWETQERENLALATAIPAHLAYAALKRAEELLPCDADPELVAQTAHCFTWSEESEEFFREQGNVFLSKMEFDDDDDMLDLHMLRMAVSDELSVVLKAVRGMPLGGYIEAEGS